jgi:molecular chaperone DnaK
MGKILGIDLGTTNSAVAVWEVDGPRLILNRQGNRLTPSVVGFGEDGGVHVGELARHEAIARAESTITSAKRFIGRSFEAVAEDREEVLYEVVAGDHGEARFLVDGERWAPEEISAIVLRELRLAAEARLGEPVEGAIITAPAHFNDAQRAATREAGRLAGLEVRRILNEPTAAALAYGLDKMIDGERLVAIYDFGGGTFDVSILSIGEDIIEVLATKGDANLGGDVIDARLAVWILEQFEAAHGFLPDEDAETLQRVREAAEGVKIDLSTMDRVDLEIPFPGEGDGSPLVLHTSITRADFDGMIADLVTRTLDRCASVLADARKTPDLIHEVVLAGGSTRIPLVRQKVGEYFGREPLSTVDPDEVVAMGAAVQAGILAGDLKGVILVDVTSLSLGIETNDGKTAVVTPRNTTIPVAVTRTFTTATDGQTEVEFHVVQGESERAAENASLGRFRLHGLRPERAGTSPIDVTFLINIDGMVMVTARDHATGVEQAVTVSVHMAVAPQRATPFAAPADVAAVALGTEPEATDIHPEGDLPPKARETLEEARQFLREAGGRMTRVDKSSLTKKIAHLRSFAAGDATPEELEHSRAALAKVVARIRKSKALQAPA